MDRTIKVGFCVSYDWFLLKKSLPRIYDHADIICLSLDKNRKSWSGSMFEFDEEGFRHFISEIDTKKKIDIYEDDFARPGFTAMQNDNNQRNLMAKRMGQGGWHIQIDADEYFLNFKEFVKNLIEINPGPSGNEKPLNICALFVPLIKKTKRGYLYVDFLSSMPESVPMATNVPIYEGARRNGHFNVIVPHYVIHETWARSEQELWFKINSWGHSDQEMKEEAFRISYFNLWKALDEFNYRYIKNFHPGVPNAWPSLGFCQGDTISEFITNFGQPKFPLSRAHMLVYNSRNIARLKSIVLKLFK